MAPFGGPPALLFEAAYHVEYKKFVDNAPAILTLAVPGVLLAITITAFTSWWLLNRVGVPFELGHAFLLASMIAATDPISVLALFRTLGVTKRLYLLVEGESLLNDGVAVVVFVIVAAVLGIETGHLHAPHLEGTAEVVMYGIRTFLWMAGGGVIIGGLLGMIVSVLTRQTSDRLVEVTLSFILAYGSFLAAEYAHASGVLSVVAAGIVLGSFGSKFGMNAATRIAVVDFWEVMAFFSNSLVFLLVGLELNIPDLIGNAGLVGLVFIAVLMGRATAIYGLLPVVRLFRIEPIPSIWSHVLFWGGLRGSLSMVLVIGLPLDFQPRSLLLLLVFGVVSVSLFLQGLTMKPLMAKLKLLKDRSAQLEYERARGKAIMATAALNELNRMSTSGHLQSAIFDKLSSVYQARRDANIARASERAGDTIDDERLQETSLHLLAIEEDVLRHAASEGILSETISEELLTQLATQREVLRHGDDGPEHMEAALAAVLGDE